MCVPESIFPEGIMVINARVRFCLLNNLVLMVSVSVEFILTSSTTPQCFKKLKVLSFTLPSLFEGFVHE